MQTLLSDVASLPSALEEVDCLDAVPNITAVKQGAATTKARRAKQKLQKILRCLLQWEDHLEGYVPYLHPSQALQRLANTGPSFGFTGLLSANVHIHVWAFQIICLVEVEKVDLYLFDCGDDDLLDSSAIRARNDFEVLGLAVKILRSLEYMLQEERKLYGPAASLFPLRTAYEALKRDHGRNSKHVKRC